MRGGEKMKQKGFTLVELLVVIAIIGILSTVAIVNLNSARDKAKFASAQAAMSQMSTPIILCLDEEVTGNIASTYGQAAADWVIPAADAAPCDASSVSGSAFPDLTGSGWSYGTNYWHDSSSYSWGFCLLHSTIDDIGCDQDGCAASSTCT
ncbi:hypothetical protein C0580_01625 [Candidatus Parcubacteria bacterium]|nr:MAG: hypothetical protein C0580_01625 [Candidatus Parcubacteria bacterium]